jgi:2Fe-2S iron-sulfur cluster binding domain
VATIAPPPTKTVTLTIDGQEITVAEGTTIWDAANAAGIEIPVLCHGEPSAEHPASPDREGGASP